MGLKRGLLLFLVFLKVFSSGFGLQKKYSCPCGEGEALAISPDEQCTCKCLKHFADLNCGLCPDWFKSCADICCKVTRVKCDDVRCTSSEAVDFVTAAKIAVLFALVVTCVAVIVALLRAFLLPRCGRPRNNASADSRSLNSVQRFVLERLRNRPPSYDHQPEKPPSYEECVIEPPTPRIQAEDIPPPAYGVAMVGSRPPVSPAPPAYATAPLILNARALPVPSPITGMSDFALLDVTTSENSLLESSMEVGHDNLSFQSYESSATFPSQSLSTQSPSQTTSSASMLREEKEMTNWLAAHIHESSSDYWALREIAAPSQEGRETFAEQGKLGKETSQEFVKAERDTQSGESPEISERECCGEPGFSKKDCRSSDEDKPGGSREGSSPECENEESGKMSSHEEEERGKSPELSTRREAKYFPEFCKKVSQRPGKQEGIRNLAFCSEDSENFSSSQLE